MLCARGGIQIDRNSAGHNHWRVIAEVKVARDAIDHGDGGEKNDACQPTAVESEGSAREPEGPHGVALNNGRMAADTADCEAEDERLARLPAKVEAPADPQRARAQIGGGEEKAEGKRDDEAHAAGGRIERLHDGVDCGKAKHRSRWPYRADEALERVAAVGELLRQGGCREKCGVGYEPAPG